VSNENLPPVRRSPRLWSLAVLAAALLAAAAWYLLADTSQSSVGPEPVAVAVTRGDIEEIVTSQGKLEPKQYVDVGSQVSGQLQKLHVAIGDEVKAGDLIAEIDPRLYEAHVDADQAKLKTLEAQRRQQEAQVAQARQTLKRNEGLKKSSAISEQVYEDAMTAVKIAEAQLLSVEAQIEEANSALDGDKVNLTYTRIYAPMAGTVVLQDMREGQTLNANQSAPRIVQLADLDTMTVRAQVAEADIMRLKPGMAVYFKTLGSGERRWNGTVRQVLPSPEVVNDVVLYNVLVDVPNADRQLMTGMSTQIFFVLGTAKDVPLMPTAALIRRATSAPPADGEAYQVRVRDGAGASEKIVYVGLMDRTRAEVKSGLELGEEVLVPTPRGQTEGSGGRSRGPRMPRL
jgi:membrane fusion protein, macrolide-specific efflux system